MVILGPFLAPEPSHLHFYTLAHPRISLLVPRPCDSSEAIYAYQKALDLKPNYMRAWTNMGISFANLGDYDK